MAKKRQKSKRSAKRSTDQQRPKRTWMQKNGLLLAAVVAAVLVVGVLIILDQTSKQGQDEADVVSMAKSLGQADAPVVVVEFGDFQCPYCGQFAKGAAQQIKETYVPTGQVRFVYRHLAFLGNESTWAAEASECAEDQGRFWDYHDKLFDEQRGENQGAYSKDNLKRFAAEIGLDTDRFDSVLTRASSVPQSAPT